MRGTLRTVGTIAFCVAIAMPIVGCRTSRESNEASAPQAPSGEIGPGAEERVGMVITPPAGFDPTKPICEPNELRNPSRPPIIYQPRVSILPLFRGQVEDIKYIVGEKTQREVWFILVLSHAKDSYSHRSFYPYRVEAYAAPDCQSGRLRRGSGVYISEDLFRTRIEPFSYAQVCETTEVFPPDLAPPDDLARLPFKVSGDISEEDIVEVVRFIRSGPSVPIRVLHNSSGKTRQIFSRDPSLDPAAPIQIISAAGDEVSVHVTGSEPHIFATYHCRKVDGVWTVVRVARGVI